MNTTNMRHKGLTYNISGSRVRLKPRGYFQNNAWAINIEGLTDDVLLIPCYTEGKMSRDVEALSRLFGRLQYLQPETWGNSKGVMSRGEIKLMRLAILIGGISVLTCLVWLLVQLLK